MIFVTLNDDGTVRDATRKPHRLTGDVFEVVQWPPAPPALPEPEIGLDGPEPVEPAPPEPFVSDGTNLAVLGVPSLHDLAWAYRVGDMLAPRPQSPAARVENGTIIVPPCPAGTTIIVFDLSGQEVMAEVIAETDDFEEVIEFADPGSYEVEVQAPTPYRPTRTMIEVPE